MAERSGKGRQRIEMKLVESEKARVVTFSKRKKTLFKHAAKLSTRTGANVGVMLFSTSGKPISHSSTSIVSITNKYFEGKLEDRQRDLAEGKSNVVEALEDLRKELHELNEKEKKRILIYKVMHPSAEIPPDEQMLKQPQAIKLRVGKVKKIAESDIKAKRLEIDLNVALSQKKMRVLELTL